ncbi:hypothetical protein [Streptomyces sp. NPDC006285]|uniref:hypothetical protein n=1 Tax=Streptomyces sp. NPDC006285 TaxID=3364742 RepID=UPI00367580A6
MDKSRQSPAPGEAGASGALLRRTVPPPALCGFLLLLALIFTCSYVAGAAVGPVAPAMHGTGTDGGTDSGGTGTGGDDDTGDMGGMGDMGERGH